jgi:hypothetical protein
MLAILSALRYGSSRCYCQKGQANHVGGNRENKGGMFEDTSFQELLRQSAAEILSLWPRPSPLCLVLSPTRKLAIQIHGKCFKFGALSFCIAWARSILSLFDLTFSFRPPADPLCFAFPALSWIPSCCVSLLDFPAPAERPLLSFFIPFLRGPMLLLRRCPRLDK